MTLSPLEELLSSRGQLAVLRALTKNRRPMTGREIARRAGVSPQRASDALAALAHLHVVSWTPAGRAALYSLEEGSELVRKVLVPLFRREEEYERDLKEAVIRLVGPGAVSVTLFGSAARGDAEPGSDIDLLVVTADPVSSRRISDRFNGRDFQLEQRFHAFLSPIVLSLEELRERKRKKIGWVRSAAKDGITLAGTPLGELLDAA